MKQELANFVSKLPADPARLSTQKLVEACKFIYTHHADIIGAATLENAAEGLRRISAIEKYVRTKAHKDEARRAARVLEAAVGVALGPYPDHGPGRGKKVPHGVPFQDCTRFRRMAEHRAEWIPKLETEALSRKQVLDIIAELARPRFSNGQALIEKADVREWLSSLADKSADLLLTDPPYSTEVDDIHKFASWLSLALRKLKPSGRALVFIGAYTDELAAYCSIALPKGWTWGTPHAWVYRNTIGPTPDKDFVRNWQFVLSARGPDAPNLKSNRITDLLAGFVDNAPDGRHEVKHHKWQKPLDVVRRLIRVTTDEGQTIIDPFAGSGTTLIAADQEKRIGIGADNDATAVSIAVKRGCIRNANERRSSERLVG